jgi:hypothetical protein
MNFVDCYRRFIGAKALPGNPNLSNPGFAVIAIVILEVIGYPVISQHKGESMRGCPNQRSWFDYWKENMESLGFQIPTTWVAGQQMVTGYIAAIVAAIEKFGPRVTVGELVAAGTVGQGLLFAASATASVVAGAAIGSAAVASGRYLACGTSLADVLAYAMENHWLTRETHKILLLYPQTYRVDVPMRSSFAQSAPLLP